jgi:hypothetical protein
MKNAIFSGKYLSASLFVWNLKKVVLFQSYGEISLSELANKYNLPKSQNSNTILV